MSPDFYDDTVLARCSHSARLLYPALWQLADRCGVFEWDSPKIRKYAFGYDDISTEKVDSLLDELLREGRIKISEFEGKRWGLIPKLPDHQHFHKDEKERNRHILEGANWSYTNASTGSAPGQHRVSRPVFGYLISEYNNGDASTVPTECARDSETVQEEKPKAETPVEESTVTKREVRSSRGAFEQVFEGMFRDAGKSNGIKVAAFDALEKSIASDLMRRCAADGVQQQALVAEWWNPVWRNVVGWRLQQLEKHYASVVAALADPGQRPKPKPQPGKSDSRNSTVPQDDSDKRHQAHKRIALENAARLDEQIATAQPPESALAELSKLKERFGWK